MKHPELLYLASHKCGVSVQRIIYDAHCINHKTYTAQSLMEMHDNFLHQREIPAFVEDYALKLLAEEEIRKRTIRLPSSFRDWVDRH